MKMLYANGDSFVFGMECLGDFNREEQNKEYAFPKHVANGLNCHTYINNAYNGATNEFIFRTTIFDLLELENQGTAPEDIFVLIGWTSLHRAEIDGISWYNRIPEYRRDPCGVGNTEANPEFIDFNTLFINPSSHTYVVTPLKKYDTDDDILPFYLEYVWHDRMQNPQQEARIIALHEFLKSKGYRHLFINTCGNFQFKMIDNTVLNYYNLQNESFFEWAVTTFKKEHRQNNHFSPVPHEAYGKLLLDHIVKNDL